MRPGMADGRCFTTYIPDCELNNNIQNRNNISNSSEYRRFLQTNATTLMDNLKDACVNDDTKTCNTCFIGSNTIDQQPDFNENYDILGYVKPGAHTYSEV